MQNPESEIKIIQVKSKGDFSRFLRVPELIQSNGSYIPPLRINIKRTLSKRLNPLWQSGESALFIARHNGELVGRIAAIYIQSSWKNSIYNRSHFGWFESVNNINCTQQLIQAAANFLKEKGSSEMTGPIMPSINYELGTLILGYDKPPFFMMNYNPDYYSVLLTKSGGKNDMEFYAYEIPCHFDKTRIKRLSTIVVKRYAAYIENVNFKKYNHEADILCDIYNDAFENHWSFTPFSKAEFRFLANELKEILDPKLLFKVKVGNEIGGFMLAIPNINELLKGNRSGKLTFKYLWKLLFQRKSIRNVKVMVVAIKQKYMHMGLGSVLYNEISHRVCESDYAGAELSWVADDNTRMKSFIQSIGAVPTKKYSVYRFEF